MKTEIPMKLPSLNEYIDACRTGRGKWNKGNDMKQKYQIAITPYIKPLGRFDKPVKINFTWVEGTKKRDLDNVCWAKKFILDAMVNAEIIPNDSYKYVTGFIDNFKHEKGIDKVIVEVVEDE